MIKKIIVSFCLFWFVQNTYADLVVFECSDCPKIEKDYGRIIKKMTYSYYGRYDHYKTLNPFLYLILGNLGFILLLVIIRRFKIKK